MPSFLLPKGAERKLEKSEESFDQKRGAAWVTRTPDTTVTNDMTAQPVPLIRWASNAKRRGLASAGPFSFYVMFRERLGRGLGVVCFSIAIASFAASSLGIAKVIG